MMASFDVANIDIDTQYKLHNKIGMLRWKVKMRLLLLLLLLVFDAITDCSA